MRSLTGGTDGRVVTINNTSNNRLIILEDDSLGGTAANRFSLRNPIFLLPNAKAQVIYDSTSSRWEPIATSGGIGYQSFFDMFDDFINSSTAVSTTAIEVGPFSGIATGTGASGQIGTYLNNTTEKPLGIYQLDTGTTATGRSHLGTTQTTVIQPAQGQAICLFRIAVEALSISTDRYQIFAGWHDAVGATTVTDGIYWQYDDAASTSWQGAAARASTRTTTGAAGPLVDVNYIWLGIYVDSTWTRATYFYSNDSTTFIIAGEQTVNLPLAANTTGWGVTINKTVGTTQRNVAIDMMAHRYDITRG